MRRIREEIDRNKERFRQLSDKVDKNTMADAETEAELQGLQAGEERRGSNASQAVECCLDTLDHLHIFTMICGTRTPRSARDAADPASVECKTNFHNLFLYLRPCLLE